MQEKRIRSRLQRAVRVVRRGLILLGAAIVVVLAGVMAFLPPASPGRLIAGALESGDPSFYAVPAGTAYAAPGTLVRSERLRSAPAGSVGWRILYHTTNLDGSDLVVCGLVVGPARPSTGGPRTVVGWGHPTTGATAGCAPSNGVDPFLIIEGVTALLRAGYVVAAPDYPGLGVVGPSSYLIGPMEANSLLDAVRAARQLDVGAGPDTVLWGTPRAAMRSCSPRRRRTPTHPS